MFDMKRLEHLPMPDDELCKEVCENCLRQRELELLTLNQLAHKLGYTSIRSLMYENGLDWDE